MRRRIQQLARGKFEHSRPSLILQTDKVDIEVLEGKDYDGDFVIASTGHEPMRGVVYSSNPRMECLTPQFEGEEVRIRYQKGGNRQFFSKCQSSWRFSPASCHLIRKD